MSKPNPAMTTNEIIKLITGAKNKSDRKKAIKVAIEVVANTKHAAQRDLIEQLIATFSR